MTQMDNWSVGFCLERIRVMGPRELWLLGEGGGNWSDDEVNLFAKMGKVFGLKLKLKVRVMSDGMGTEQEQQRARRPWMVIAKSASGAVVKSWVQRFQSVMEKGDAVVWMGWHEVEERRVVLRFQNRHVVEWDAMEGGGAMALCRTQWGRFSMEEKTPELKGWVAALKRGEFERVLEEAESESRPASAYLRGYAMWRMGKLVEACRALRGELALNPGHEPARRLLNQWMEELPEVAMGEGSFRELARRVRVDTLLDDAALHRIWQVGRRVCQMDMAGDFVVVGDEGGGVRGLLEGVVSRYSRGSRAVRSVRADEEVVEVMGLLHVQTSCLVDSGMSLADLMERWREVLPFEDAVMVEGAESGHCRFGKVLKRHYRLNLGCGRRFHEDWVNLDLVPFSEEVVAHDFTVEGLPFGDGSCEAVYHSHVLEHLPREVVPGFLAECRRVLGGGGVLRVVVPDMEGSARLYLEHLQRGLAGDEESCRIHEWMTIEMVDQLGRHRPGGEMMRYWSRCPMPAHAFVVERLGQEVRDALGRLTLEPERTTEGLPTAEEVGRFRTGGEVHQWMYDRLSLPKLLLEAGFDEVRICGAGESWIEGFAGYELDTDEQGRVRKPESLFVEARRV